MGLVNGRGRFSTLHSSETPRPTIMKLTPLPRMQHFRGLCRRGWSGQIASLTHESLFIFTFLHHAHRFLDTSPREIRHYTLFPLRKSLLGLETWNMKFAPPLSPQKRKNLDFKLAVSVTLWLRQIWNGKSYPLQTWCGVEHTRDLTPRSKGQWSRLPNADKVHKNGRYAARL